MSDEAVGLTADKVCDSALAFESVCRSEKGAGEILSGITARFAASRLVALVGADGAGKTTLMRIAAGILQPRRGMCWCLAKSFTAKSSLICKSSAAICRRSSGSMKI